MNCSTPNRNLPGTFTGNSFADDFLVQLDRTASGAPADEDDCVRVLDVGTGTARIPIEICARRGDIRFTVVDRSSRAWQAARRKVERAGLSRNIRIEQADASSLPFANGSFDAVISNSLMHHVANRLGVLNEMLRVLRPGGLLFIRDTLPGADARQIAQVLSSLSEAPHSKRAVFERAIGAMLSIEEARELAAAAGLPRECVRQNGPRLWLLAIRIQPVPVDHLCGATGH